MSKFPRKYPIFPVLWAHKTDPLYTSPRSTKTTMATRIIGYLEPLTGENTDARQWFERFDLFCAANRLFIKDLRYKKPPTSSYLTRLNASFCTSDGIYTFWDAP